VVIPSFSEVSKAHQKIAPFIHRTPVLTNHQVDERSGANVFFKCENFQKVGAFKFRGACNAVFSLPDEQAVNGVATHSSGNHAQAIALAAKIKGIPAHIVMPENAPAVKKKAVKGYGAHITFCESTLEGRESTLAKVVEKTGATFIHPYNDSRIIAGQGTAAVELLQDYPDLDIILAPVGGGGLLSGTAIAADGINSSIQVIGCEPEIADDAYRSFKAGELQPVNRTDTVADGLRTALGELTFACIKQHVDDIATVSEEQIVEAMRFIWERMNIIIEASCAVPVAALFHNKVDAKNKKVGIIITGGNVDLDHLPWNMGTAE
jgi:threonine dehydratase